MHKRYTHPRMLLHPRTGRSHPRSPGTLLGPPPSRCSSNDSSPHAPKSHSCFQSPSVRRISCGALHQIRTRLGRGMYWHPLGICRPPLWKQRRRHHPPGPHCGGICTCSGRPRPIVLRTSRSTAAVHCWRGLSTACGKPAATRPRVPDIAPFCLLRNQRRSGAASGSVHALRHRQQLQSATLD